MYSNNYLITGKLLEELVLSLPIPAHIKEMPSGRCILTNEQNLKLYNISTADQMLGKTVFDLDVLMKYRWGKSFAYNIDKLDKQIASTGGGFYDKNRIFVTVDGTVRIQDMTKIPIVNTTNKNTAIFTCSFDKTENVNLKDLLKAYQKVYKNKKEAAKYMCNYLNINDFFEIPPTLAELNYMLFAKNYNHKLSISNAMKVGVKTCESHVTNLNRKVKRGTHVDVINFLRLTTSGRVAVMDAKLCG